jgi:3-deoxy-D-manno-octulosonic-acid transferase
VWIHAASVGETVAALTLVERLTQRGLSLLMTTGTVTAAQIAEQRLPKAAIHQFVPIDTPAAIRRFLDHWQPDLAVLVESELWPTTLRMVAERQAPVVVANARMSERSFRTWRKAPPLAAAVVSRVAQWLAQSEGDAERLRALGARNVRICGNLKFDAPLPPVDEAALREFRSAIGERPVFLAASTHAGEEAAAIAAHREIAADEKGLLTVLAPRHPERGDSIAAEVAAAHLSLGRRSQGDPIGPGTEMLLADTIGEMGLWYRLAHVAFLGGSMLPRGSQNPIEPAKLGVPVVHGEHVGAFRDVYAALTAANAVVRISDAASLTATLRRLLADGEERKRLACAAHACVERFTGALDLTMDALLPYLDAAVTRHEASART